MCMRRNVPYSKRLRQVSFRHRWGKKSAFIAYFPGPDWPENIYTEYIHLRQKVSVLSVPTLFPLGKNYPFGISPEFYFLFSINFNMFISCYIIILITQIFIWLKVLILCVNLFWVNFCPHFNTFLPLWTSIFWHIQK
jgi:hypothetical protein